MAYQLGPNDLLRTARRARLSSSGSGRPMSRQELAEAVSAWLFERTGRSCGIDAGYIGKLERGSPRWPRAHYRTAFRAVLGAETDADLGFCVVRGNASDPVQAAPETGDGAGKTGAPMPDVDAAPHPMPLAEVVDAFAVPVAGAGTAVRVSVIAQAGTPVTVACPNGTAVRVAVQVGPVRVLIDASDTGPNGLAPTAVDFLPGLVDGARVYSLARRRAG